MTFADWLVEQLRRSGHTQAWLADQLGVARSRVTDWIHGRNLPNEDNLIELAELFGVDRNTVLIRAGRIDAPPEFSMEVANLAADIDDQLTHISDPELRVLALNLIRDNANLILSSIREIQRKFNGKDGDDGPDRSTWND